MPEKNCKKLANVMLPLSTFQSAAGLWFGFSFYAHSNVTWQSPQELGLLGLNGPDQSYLGPPHLTAHGSRSCILAQPGAFNPCQSYAESVSSSLSSWTDHWDVRCGLLPRKKNPDFFIRLENYVERILLTCLLVSLDLIFTESWK